MSQEVFEPKVSPLADETAPTGRRPDWLVPVIVGSALMLQSLESTVISNALPTMARALGEDPLRLNMAITMFLLASAVCLPISSWIADRYGAKRVFMASMALFAVASAGCGFAHTLPQLVVARVLQGAACAMMAPVARLLILRTTPKSNLVGALSIYAIPALFAPMAGPVVGGFIVTYFDWRWIFFINLPLAAVGVTLAKIFVPDVGREAVAPIDWLGLAMTGVGLAGLIFGLENLGRAFLPAWQVALLFVVAFAALGAYARRARGDPHALVDLSLFRIPTFAAATIGGGFQRIGVGATPFLLAMLLQVGFGMSALTAGVMIVLSGAGALAMKGVAPPLLRKVGFRRIVVVNGVISASTYLLYAAINPGMALWVMAVLLAAGSLFRSLQFTALSSLAFADIDSAQMSRASTLTTMGQQLMQTVGVGLAAVLLHVFQRLRGDAELTWQAVGPVFVVLAALSLVSLAWFVRLPQDAGDALSGRTAP